MADKKFVDGMFVKKRAFGNGEPIIGLNVNVEVLKKFLDENVNEQGFVNIDCKTSLSGDKMYAELNTYVSSNAASVPPVVEPEPENEPEEDDDLPF